MRDEALSCDTTQTTTPHELDTRKLSTPRRGNGNNDIIFSTLDVTKQQSKCDLRAPPANLPTVARVVTPGSTAPTLFTYRYLARRGGAADAPRSYADEKLYS